MAISSNMLIDVNDIVVHFETNDMIDAGLFGGLLIDIEKLAKGEDLFGPDAEVRLAEIRTGSITARLKIVAPKLAEAAITAGVTAFATALVTQLTSPEAPAAQKVAQIIVDQSVTYVEIRTTEGNYVIPSDNPAVMALQAERDMSGLVIKPEMLNQLSKLVNVKMPRVPEPKPEDFIEDLSIFAPAYFEFLPFIQKPSADTVGQWHARGIISARSDGTGLFRDTSGHTTPIHRMDHDWDLPLGVPMDVWFEAEKNNPVTSRALKVIRIEVQH